MPYAHAMILRIRLLAVVLALAMGCATTSKVDWQSRVGNYSYDAAVRELGVPERETTLGDGSRVAEWLTSRGSYYGTASYFTGAHFQQFDLDKFPDRFVRLTFNAKGILTQVQKAYK